MLVPVLFAAALASPAPPVAAGPTVTAPPSAKPKDELICRSEPEPGSRLTHKVCMTPAQMAERLRQGRDVLGHIQHGYSAPDGMMHSMSPR